MIKRVVARAGAAGVGAKVLTRSGVIRPISPVKLAKLGLAVSRWGTGPAGGFQALAIRWPERPGLVDGLVEALTDLVGGGAIWLLTPKIGRPNSVEPADIAEAAPIAGLSQTTSASVSADWAATRLVAPKTPA